MNEIEFGSLIIRRRKALGISQKILAELSGVSVHALSDIEARKASPTVATLVRLFTALGLELRVQAREPEAR